MPCGFYWCDSSNKDNNSENRFIDANYDSDTNPHRQYLNGRRCDDDNGHQYRQHDEHDNASCNNGCCERCAIARNARNVRWSSNAAASVRLERRGCSSAFRTAVFRDSSNSNSCAVAMGANSSSSSSGAAAAAAAAASHEGGHHGCTSSGGGGAYGDGSGSVGSVLTPNSSSANSSGCSGNGNYVREARRKKVTGFATLRKKFIRRRRSSKACDHGRVFREFLSDWSPIEVAALLEEYEALAALKDLSVQAELARPPATTFKQDLSALYDCKYATDCDLVFRGSVFPVHRSLLSSRCSYFRDLLAGCPGFGARICLELRSSPVDVPMFSSLLRYLYTGDLCPQDATIDVNLLRRLGDDFGTPNPLEHDLR